MTCSFLTSSPFLDPSRMLVFLTLAPPPTGVAMSASNSDGARSPFTDRLPLKALCDGYRPVGSPEPT